MANPTTPPTKPPRTISFASKALLIPYFWRGSLGWVGWPATIVFYPKKQVATWHLMFLGWCAFSGFNLKNDELIELDFIFPQQNRCRKHQELKLQQG